MPAPHEKEMIDWLIQTQAADPHLARGTPPPGLLSKKETGIFQKLHSDKRRQDWLLGRWTAKQLLQQVIWKQYEEGVPLNALEVVAGEDGAPRVQVLNDHNACWTVSISHSRGTAFCAAVAGEEQPLGADIEYVEPRPWQFVGDYFTREEQALLAGNNGEPQDDLVTAIWSGKESALKAIRMGLKVDARSVSCHPLPAVNGDAWRPLQMSWKQERLARPAPALSGWWRTNGRYVLTLASGSG